MATDQAGAAIDEEFQRLLALAGEASKRGDLEPAREALEDALAIRSRDPQVLGQLGQVFYRLGRYDDAAIAWQRLVDDNPVEPGARVNLGLAWMKARQYEEAIKQLRIALDLNPEHRKAAGYLGLAWLEVGQPAQARGDDLLGAPAELRPELRAAEPIEAVEPPPEAVTEAPIAPAEEPTITLEEEPVMEPAVSFEPDTETAAPASADPAVTFGPATEEAAPPDAPPTLSQLPAAPRQAEPSGLPTLAGFAAARAVHGPVGQAFVADGATLTVNVHGELLCRLAGLAAWRGELAFAGEMKRFRGQSTDKPFGVPPEQMHRLAGDGLVVLRAAGRRFMVLELGGEAGYFREAVVFGFQEQVAFENGRLPSPSGGLDLVHLRGRGRLVLVTRGEPVAVEVTPYSPVHVPLSSLVGWTGALAPRITPLFAGGADGEAVEISGEGRVLVDPGPTGRPGEPA
jgi:hypothetical protein